LTFGCFEQGTCNKTADGCGNKKTAIMGDCLVILRAEGITFVDSTLDFNLTIFSCRVSMALPQEQKKT